MASFRDDQEDYGRLDFRILQNGATVLYHSPHVLEEDLRWFREQSYLVREMDCGTWRSEDDIHAQISDTLGFPEYYGKNLDALNDCLSDVPVPDEGGMLIVLRHFDVFAYTFRQIAQAILDIVETNSRRHLLFGKKLVVAVQTDDPRLSFDPVGCCAVAWNPKEWLNSDRGV